MAARSDVGSPHDPAALLSPFPLSSLSPLIPFILCLFQMLLESASPSFLLLGAVVILSVAYLIRRTFKNPPQQPLENAPFALSIDPVDPSFDWKTEPQRPYRPYKSGPFHMTMGIKSLPYNDWLLIDNSYISLTNEKQRITETEREHTVLTMPEASDALYETYDMCLGFLKDRYPMYFIPLGVQTESSLLASAPPPPKVSYSLMYNAIRQEYIPLNAQEYISKSAAAVEDVQKTLIRVLTRTMQEDFLILIFDPKTEQYFLKSGSFSFPSGFDPAQKLNMPLKDIHKPVPFYKAKIQSPMDKFFKRMKVGYWVQRYNWGVQTHTQLYAPDLNHPHGEESEENDTRNPEDDDSFDYSLIKPLDAADMDFKNGVFLRCERQILLRLPKTNALLFTIRTYMTPLDQIREQEPPENSVNLIEAIKNLPPAMAHYKLAEEWGPAVISYLNRETDGLVREK